MAKYSSFEEMEVYQKALIFAGNVYTLTKNNEKLASDFGINGQFQRAALSISNNISEGFDRETKKEMIRFLYFSKGGAGECRNILNFLKLQDYIDEAVYLNHKNQIVEISKQLGNYIKYLKNIELQDKLKTKK